MLLRVLLGKNSSFLQRKIGGLSPSTASIGGALAPPVPPPLTCTMATSEPTYICPQRKTWEQSQLGGEGGGEGGEGGGGDATTVRSLSNYLS